MTFDAKQKVLFAIHDELQKDTPEMMRVTPENLGIDPVHFKVAVDKLACESLIEGAVIITEGKWPIPRMVCVSHARLTKRGFRCIAENIQLAI